MDFLFTFIEPSKIIPTIVAVLSSTTFSNIINYFLKRRKRPRILSANEDFLKIFIFYITQCIIPSKKEIKELREALVKKHQVSISSLCPIEVILKKISAYVLLSETISSEDKLKFYNGLKSTRTSLISNDYIQKENLLYLYLKQFFQEALFIFSILLLIMLLSLLEHNDFPEVYTTWFWIVVLLFFLSCIGALGSRIFLYILDEIKNHILYFCKKATSVYERSHQKK